MRNKLFWLLLIIVAASACAASGPRFYKSESTIKAPNADMARIFFYRPVFWYGSAGKVIIYINNLEVGSLSKGSVIFRDVERGKYLIKITLGVTQHVLPITINAGEIKYVRVGSAGSLLSGDFQPVLVEPETAIFDMRDLALLD